MSRSSARSPARSAESRGIGVVGVPLEMASDREAAEGGAQVESAACERAQERGRDLVLAERVPRGDDGVDDFVVRGVVRAVEHHADVDGVRELLFRRRDRRVAPARGGPVCVHQRPHRAAVHASILPGYAGIGTSAPAGASASRESLAPARTRSAAGSAVLRRGKRGTRRSPCRLSLVAQSPTPLPRRLSAPRRRRR